MNILETKGLYHDFKGLEVLFDVNLEVKEGERHAVIGPNGAGKDHPLQCHHRDLPSRRKDRWSFKGKDITGAKASPTIAPWHGAILSDHQHL